MANQVKSYFKVPTITQIRKNKDPIIIESKSQLVKILLELSNSYEDELKEKYLVINYPTIPKKFKLNKKYEKRGKLALYELKNIEDSRTVSDCLFLELGKMRRPEEVICFGLKFDIGKILTNDELEQTQEKKANILLRPADLIRAKKLKFSCKNKSKR